MTFDSNLFNRTQQKVIADSFQKTNERKIKLAIQTGSNAIKATPVDTGRAKNNWQYAINAPKGSRVAGEGFDKTGGAAIAKGTAIALKSKPGDTIYVTNNLDYIGELNKGKSVQAEAGFIEEALRIALIELGEG